MIYLLAAVIAALLIERYLESRRRDIENDSWRDLFKVEQAAHRFETANLLQRIQAPERAVTQHEISQAMELEMPQPPQTDEEFEEYREQQELIWQMEARENAHLGIGA